MAKHTKSHPCPDCGAEMTLKAEKIRPYKGNKKTYICTVCSLSDTLYADHENDLLDEIDSKGSSEETVFCRHDIPEDECLICSSDY